MQYPTSLPFHIILNESKTFQNYSSGPFLNNQIQNTDERQIGMKTTLGHSYSPVTNVPSWASLLRTDLITRNVSIYLVFSLPGFNLLSLN